MTTDGRELFIDDNGSGRAVVLLHGTPSSPEDFRPLVDTLARNHRVLVPHLPGYGRTPPHPGSYSLPAVIARLEDAITRSGVSEAAFVGFSGGAYKAVAMALGGRLTVTGLLLMSPVLGLDAPVAQAYREMANAARARAFDPRPTWLDRMASPGLATRNGAVADRILSWLDAAPLSVLCDELVALANAPDLRPRVRELACPLLVCSGADDTAVPPSWSRAVAESLTRGRFHSVEGAGHALFVEAPRETLRVIAEFLEAA